jgi:multidrug efflux pump subunit AcrA (membrane-fusion protein)
MKKYVRLVVFIAVVGGMLSFITYSFVRSSSPPKAAPPPDLRTSPARVYGVVEPAGREVLVSPPVTKEVVTILVKEGDLVTQGQILCVLENDVESAQLTLAQAKADAARRELAKSQDETKRKKELYGKNVDSEYAYTQSRLQVEIDSSNLVVALKEEDLAKARLSQLELKSPIDGFVYKFDVRLGETLSEGDNARITLGPKELWVRLFVESYWMNRITLASHYTIYDSETNEYLGEGEVLYKAPYVGRRNFRTEDTQERFDTKFQEVVLSLQGTKDTIPIGLSVVAELAEK